MTVTQYIGARYVPIFADPIDWDISKEYEPLTIVYWMGNSYTSRQAVPKNIDISNNDYWAITGNYNAQIEQYRQEVKAYDGRITDNAQAIAKEVTDRMEADKEIQALIKSTSDNLTGQVDAVNQKIEGLGTSAKTDYDQNPTANSKNLVTSGGVKSALDALDGRITTVNDSIATVSTKFQLQNNFRGKKSLFISDSWGVAQQQYNVNKTFIEIFSDQLGLINENLSKGSTGFCRGGVDTYLNRLKSWVETNKSKVNEISYIFVEGSSNDYSYENTMIRNAVVEFANYVGDTFPNCLLYIIPQMGTPNMFLPDMSISENVWVKVNRNVIAGVINNTIHAPYVLFNDSLYAMAESKLSYAMNADNVHPNQMGHNILARWLIQKVLTGNSYIYIAPGVHNVKVYELDKSFNIIKQVTPKDLRFEGSIVNGVLDLTWYVEHTISGTTPKFLCISDPCFIPLNQSTAEQSMNYPAYAYNPDANAPYMQWVLPNNKGYGTNGIAGVAIYRYGDNLSNYAGSFIGGGHITYPLTFNPSDLGQNNVIM